MVEADAAVKQATKIGDLRQVSVAFIEPLQSFLLEVLDVFPVFI